MPTSDRPSPSRALLTAALGALIWTAPACGGAAAPPTGTPDSGSPPDQAFECTTGVSSNPTVTSSTVEAMTYDQFSSACQARSGVFEIQPECSGQNHCRGMSYDTGTQTLTEHTCRATNTCAGYACIICG